MPPGSPVSAARPHHRRARKSIPLRLSLCLYCWHKASTGSAAAQVARTPSCQTPVHTSCYGQGYGYGYGNNSSASCITTDDQTIGGKTCRYDANAGLRQQAAGRCMARNGLRYVATPACPKGTTVAHLKHAIRPPAHHDHLLCRHRE